MISTKGRYALRLMLYLAHKYKEGFIPLKEIAQNQEISKKYLEIIVKALVSKGLLEGMSGKGGGYKLCKAPDEYFLGEIIEATEGPLIAVACLSGDNRCSRKNICETLPLWVEYSETMHNFFYSKKLSDLL